MNSSLAPCNQAFLKARVCLWAKKRLTVICALLPLDSRRALEIDTPLCRPRLLFSQLEQERPSCSLPAKAGGLHLALLEVASQPALENRELSKKVTWIL